MTTKTLNEKINKLENRVKALEQILEFEMKKVKIWTELYKRPNDNITLTSINTDTCTTILSCQTVGPKHD